MQLPKDMHSFTIRNILFMLARIKLDTVIIAVRIKLTLLRKFFEMDAKFKPATIGFDHAMMPCDLPQKLGKGEHCLATDHSASV